MILSNVEIHQALKDGRIVIDPLPQPYFPEVEGAHCPYDTHSVDVHGPRRTRLAARRRTAPTTLIRLTCCSAT